MSWTLTLEELVKATGGKLLSQMATSFDGVGTDTRKAMTGKIFIALKGGNFDAHNFLPQAVKQGAHCLLVHQAPSADVMKQTTVVLVTDTLKALQDLAHYWRCKYKFKVIGITGSNGKTTTKEFTRAILSDHFRISASQGSFNNHWGVPLSLLSAPPETQVVIQEMGMSHEGELTRLAEIAEPDVVVVTMVGSGHIGELGSQENVARAKNEIYLAKTPTVQIFNLDNEWTIKMLEESTLRNPALKRITFSAFRGADVQMRVVRMGNLQLEIVGQIGGVEGKAVVPVMGRQNIVNLMAASAIGLAMGVPPKTIWKSLPNCRGSWGRNQVFHLKNGTPILFDAYNANPESMAALVKNLTEIDVAGKKVAVLGEMLELGIKSPSEHRVLGELVGRANLDVVWFMGAHKADFEAGLKAEKFEKTYYISDTYEQTLALKIASVLNDSDIAVIKGSRGMKLEQVLGDWQPVEQFQKGD